jgi:threonine dehydrogenase-like Zn-dependent dehydrogenase
MSSCGSAGICGSDVTAYLYGGQYAGVFPGREFGHEMVGYVGEAGNNVKDVTEGMWVFVNPVTCQPNPSESDMAGAFSEDVVIDCAAALNIPADFLSWAKPGARLSCVGLSMRCR